MKVDPMAVIISVNGYCDDKGMGVGMVAETLDSVLVGRRALFLGSGEAEEAQFHAIAEGLKLASELSAKTVMIRSSSKFAMNGANAGWPRVKDGGILAVVKTIKERSEAFEKVRYLTVEKSENHEAITLSKAAKDGYYSQIFMAKLTNRRREAVWGDKVKRAYTLHGRIKTGWGILFDPFEDEYVDSEAATEEWETLFGKWESWVKEYEPLVEELYRNGVREDFYTCKKCGGEQPIAYLETCTFCREEPPSKVVVATLGDHIRVKMLELAGYTGDPDKAPEDLCLTLAGGKITNITKNSHAEAESLLSRNRLAREAALSRLTELGITVPNYTAVRLEELR